MIIPEVAECILSGKHLDEVDEDGYCCECGFQEGWDYDTDNWEEEYLELFPHEATFTVQGYIETFDNLAGVRGLATNAVSLGTKLYYNDRIATVIGLEFLGPQHLKDGQIGIIVDIPVWFFRVESNWTYDAETTRK